MICDDLWWFVTICDEWSEQKDEVVITILLRLTRQVSLYRSREEENKSHLGSRYGRSQISSLFGIGGGRSQMWFFPPFHFTATRTIARYKRYIWQKKRKKWIFGIWALGGCKDRPYNLSYVSSVSPNLFLNNNDNILENYTYYLTVHTESLNATTGATIFISFFANASVILIPTVKWSALEGSTLLLLSSARLMQMSGSPRYPPKSGVHVPRIPRRRRCCSTDHSGHGGGPWLAGSSLFTSLWGGTWVELLIAEHS